MLFSTFNRKGDGNEEDDEEEELAFTLTTMSRGRR
jgi:hypothetical protein